MKLILAVVILILAVALLAMWVLRRNRGSSTTQNSSEPITVPYRDNMPVSDNDLDPENDLMKTSVTDYLVYDMDVPTWRKIVVGVVRCEIWTYPAWLEVRVDDGTWLSFESGTNAEFTRWTELPRNEIPFPGPEQNEIIYGGVVYKRNDFGEGKYTSTGDTGVNASGVVEFVEFIAPNGEKYISFERFDDNDFTLSLGEKLLPSALHRHPGQNSPL